MGGRPGSWVIVIGNNLKEEVTLLPPPPPCRRHHPLWPQRSALGMNVLTAHRTNLQMN